MAFDREKKKKITVIAIATILVVAAVVGTFVHSRKLSHSRNDKLVEIHTEEKTGLLILTAVTATTVVILCKYTDFRDVCMQTLDRIRAGIREPRQLIVGGFMSAVERIQVAIEKSFSLRQAETDSRTQMALDQCKELLTVSIEDLKRSVNRVDTCEPANIKDNTVDLRVWLSGSVTYQETCLDAFVNTSGNAGASMTTLLELGSKLTRNSLAMIDGIIELSGGTPRGGGQSTTVVDWKIDQSTQVPQPNPGRMRFDWRVNRNRNRPVTPEPKPNNVVVDWKAAQSSEVVADPQPKPRTATIDVKWKADASFKRTRTRGTIKAVEGGETQMGNRRMLDQMSNDENEPDSNSNDQMADDGYPSWSDDARRSLINVDPKTVKPNAVVAQDGSGNFKTITEAVATAPQKSTELFVILIKTGVYKEYVTIPRHTNNVVFLGEGPTKTRITGNKNNVDGVSTYLSSTVSVNGDGFMAKDIGFENTAGPEKHQAVALRVSADMTIFHNCAMDAFQDTLYTHSYRQFYRQCVISGTVDFIFGNAAAVFQDCKMVVRKPMDNQACMVTAQGRKDQHSVGGLVLDGCTITAEPAFMNASPMPKAYLGRPWKEFSRTIIMQSFIDKNIDPEGWAPWQGTFALDTCFYAEVNNKGPGADMSKRVKWKGIKKLSPQQAQSFAPGIYIQGDEWIKASSVPYDAGLMKV